MRRTFGALVAVACATALAGTSSAAMLKPGDPAPAFKLQGSDGKVHDLSAYKGRTVVLAWFPKAFTGGCTAECKSLHETGDSIRNYKVAYFAISVDDAETNKKFAASLSCDFPILADPQKKVAEAYGVLIPGIGVANRWTFYIGPDGKILDIDREVKPATAGADVAAKLDALKVAKAK